MTAGSVSNPSRTLLDPTGARNLAIRERAARISSLAGRTVGLLDISKPRGNLFLDRLQERLEKQIRRDVRRTARPSAQDLPGQAREVHHP